ncbi:MAG: HAMP domain-containing sensor histidine kinase, partial [Planctomycetota bacterium]|nr:HAMP domain-containing sensor histidine kinase [Planctomycetota bacterium]
MRPWHIWTAYVAALLLIVAAVGWLSLRAVQSDRAETVAIQQALLEENVRLALWRMDSAQAVLIANENARPYKLYSRHYAPELANGKSAGKTTSPLILSPLVVPNTPETLLYFQIDASGRLTSPQVAEAVQAYQQANLPGSAGKDSEVNTGADANNKVAAQRHFDRVKQLIRLEEIAAQLPAVEATDLEPGIQVASGAAISNIPFAVNPAVQSDQFANAQDIPAELQAPNLPGGQRSNTNNSRQQIAQNYIAQNTSRKGVPNQGADSVKPQMQQTRGESEFEARAKYVNINEATSRISSVNSDRYIQAATAPVASVKMSRMVPCWVQGELILARRLEIGDRWFVQGCLLDWPRIQSGLLSTIQDLLPAAQLEPVTSDPADNFSRLMASLPVRLLPGSLPSTPSRDWSPITQSLILTWASMLLGAGAVAFLLQGVISLSERRGAFVSAVTHELRTPLTTFRMYAEMLAEGMVPDRSTQQSYLTTLRVEADRLTHLVENVLAYARLERGGLNGRIRPIAVSEILTEGAARLVERTSQANVTLKIEADDLTKNTLVLADLSAVEQILFNLVDNACKYAVNGTDRTFYLECEVVKKNVRLRLRDTGPGVAPHLRRGLFRPFHKSADAAAGTAPGVGLGLSLSRRLARQMHGDLRHIDT